MQIDHLVWAAPELDSAIARLERLTGVRARPGGAHPGTGALNALLPLGTRRYLEVLAPDPAQASLAASALALTKLGGPVLHTFAMATGRLDRLAAKMEKASLPHAGIIPMSRRLPSGRLVRWRLLIPTGHAYGPLIPFFIDWGDSPHPSEDGDDGCALGQIRLSHPDAWSLRPLLARLDVEVEVETGPAAITAEISTPNGLVELSSRDYVPG